MMKVLNVSLLLAVVLGMHTACTTKPISVSATRGETIIFPIASDYEAYTVGFSSQALGYQDWQFGKTIFKLTPVQPSACQPFEIQPRWITRVWAHPASPAGISNSLGMNSIGSSQVLAALDIPPTACVGTYRWSVENRLEPNVPLPPGGGWPIEGDLFRNIPGPGIPPSLGEFRIFAATTPPISANPLEAVVPDVYGGTFGLATAATQLIPYHKIMWVMTNTCQVVPCYRPAAGDIKFLFPTARMVVKTVFEENSLGRGSIVRWCVSGQPLCPPDNTSDGMGELHVHFVDPDRHLTTLSIAFDVVNPTSLGPVWDNDFGLSGIRTAEVRLYDLDGNDITYQFYLAFGGIS